MGPFYPQQPSAAYVPKELLDGLEALLDNASTSNRGFPHKHIEVLTLVTLLDTGDVQFVCLERREDPDLVEPDSPDKIGRAHV